MGDLDWSLVVAGNRIVGLGGGGVGGDGGHDGGKEVLVEGTDLGGGGEVWGFGGEEGGRRGGEFGVVVVG